MSYVLLCAFMCFYVLCAFSCRFVEVGMTFYYHRSGINPAGIYLLTVNNRNIRTRCEICSNWTIKVPERRHWRRSCIFIVNFEHISHLDLVFSIVNFEHVIAGWERINASQCSPTFSAEYWKALRYPANIYLIKVNNRNTNERCEIVSKLTIKTPKRRHWRHCGVFMVNFQPMSHLFLVLLLLTLRRWLFAGYRGYWHKMDELPSCSFISF